MNSAQEPAEPINLLDLDRAGLERFFTELGEKPFRATQVMQWLYQRDVDDFDAISNLSKALRAELQQRCVIRMPELVREQRASDGTRKWVVQLDGANQVETVFIPEDDRNTLCVSSQVGCALACSFCSTARQGFNRNLTVAEIIGQLRLAQRLVGPNTRISNVVLMGMGEPLLNFERTVTAMRIMLDDFAYGLSKRRVTVSTSGIVPAMYRLTEECNVSLAVSLHAVNDTLRNELVPINQKYPLAELLAACRANVASAPRRRITFEYVMLDGVNDSVADAKALVRLLADVPSKINLIPFNPFPHSPYRTSSPAAIERFLNVLHCSGMVATVRKTRGSDIDAACGQLVGQVLDKSRRHLKQLPTHEQAA